MRIPEQLIPFFADEIGTKPPGENRGPRPIQASSAFRSALPEALAKQQRALDKPDPSARKESDHSESAPSRRLQPSRESTDTPRRKESHPVLLDTRRLPSRRKSDPHSVINIEI